MAEKNLLRKENLAANYIVLVTEGKQWRTIPYLAHRYEISDDLELYMGSDYFNDEIIGSPQKDDVAVIPVRSTGNAKEVPEYDVCWYPSTTYGFARLNQIDQDKSIVCQRYNKGIPMLQICNVKLQHGSAYHVKYSWKLGEVTDEECKLEIEGSDESEQVKETVRFCFATNDIDKLLSRIVDGYEVRYMLCTDAIRLGLELEIALSSPHSALDLNSVHGEVKLEIERNGNPYTIHLLPDQRRTKKPKLDLSGKIGKISIIRNVPRNLHDPMKLVVKLNDSSGMINVDGFHKIYPYKIPVDQEEYLCFDNGYIKIKIFWGCCVRVGKGLCTGVCTCEPAEFVGFCRPGEDSYNSMDTEE